MSIKKTFDYIVKRLRNKFITQENKILYVVPGFGSEWNGMGQNLYSEFLVFRNTINEICNLSKNVFNFNLLDAFVNKEFQICKCDNTALKLLFHCSIHIGIINLWKSKGLKPGAYIGTSWGLISAYYGVEALSLKEAVNLIYIYSDLYNYSKRDGIQIIIDTNSLKIKRIISKSKGKLHLMSNSPRSRKFLFCEKKDFEEINLLFKKQKLKPLMFDFEIASHTRFIKEKETEEYFLCLFKEFEKKPLKYDLYSSYKGNMINSGSTLTENYWYRMITETSEVELSFKNALLDGYNIVLDLSFESKLKKDIISISNLTGKKAKCFSTLLYKENEVLTFYAAYKKLAHLNLIKNTKPYIYNNNKEVKPINNANLLDSNFIKNPYPGLREMQNYNPVQYFEKHKFWLVFNYNDVDFALKNPEIFSSVQGKNMDYVLLGAEPIDHIKSRKVLAPYFSTKKIKQLSFTIKEEAEKILENYSAKEIDIVNNYAIPLTETIIAKFIGLSKKELKKIQLLLNNTNRYQLTYFSEIESFFSSYLDDLDNKKDTFCTQILKEGGFSKTELTSILKLLWIAGTTTTSMLISSSILLFFKYPNVLKELKKDSLKLKPFIEEVLRYESPEKTSWRLTLKDIELSGVLIPKNSNVHLNLTSANRDPKIFEKPDVFNVNRINTKKHLAFNSGPHYCIGAQLAMLETKIALEVLIDVLPNMVLTTNKSDINYLKSTHFRALETLKIK